jgi:uncharacterized surface protein with fasciclin (FAS1) repeats
MRVRAAAVVMITLIGLAGCSAGDDADGGSDPSSGTEALVHGPLCDLLPAGTDPGNPGQLVTQPVDTALTWIPVLTSFEAAVRASGLAEEWAALPQLTVLAPTDDAFAAKFSTADLDELLLTRHDDLRDLLRAHVVDRSLGVAELGRAGTVTTLDGTTSPVTAVGRMVRIADRAETVCADYRMANGRIHVINGVLGGLPTTAGEDDGHH